MSSDASPAVPARRGRLVAPVLGAALIVAGVSACRTAAPNHAPAHRGAPAAQAWFELGGRRLLLEACAENVVRVAFASDPAFFQRRSLASLPKRCPGVTWQRTEQSGAVLLSTPKLTLRLDTSSGLIEFLDAGRQPILREAGRTLAPANVQGDRTHHVQQQWQPEAGESLYGLGQQQRGILDLKDYDLDLYQFNTQVVVPFLVSSRGWGVLWDNTSYTRFGDLRQPERLPVTGLYDVDGKVAGASTGQVGWQGELVPAQSGEHTFYVFSSGLIRLWVDNQLVIDHFRQAWLQDTEIARVRLEQGRRVTLRLEWKSDGDGVRVLDFRWKTPARERKTSLWSEVGDGVDYYFVYGPELDDVVAGYRRLTGDAPLLPRWAYGLWQSRERYQRAQDLIDALAGYRSRHIPLDVIVQDWRYWPEGQWGSHAFDPERFPAPEAWIDEIHHKYQARLLISAWPKFHLGTDTYAELSRQPGFVYPRNVEERRQDFLQQPFTYYDAFNSGARGMYWKQLSTRLWSKGIDGFWLDASEPEIVEGPFESSAARREAYQTHMHPTALGSGSRMLNAYSLVNSQAVYQGQRSQAPDRRVVILTRSAFAGQQRHAAVTWSGDITSTWTALQKQIPAGLGFSISGIPYWTVDSGGFSVPPWFQAGDSEEWRELNVRWFEYATFLPVLRVHGQAPAREMWEFGGDRYPAFAAELKFDRLRYRLLPYVYSLAGAVTHEAGTILRPLVMDFRQDVAALQVRDQYMFGPALLISPVTTYRARSRRVYLPGSGGWFDFWTGQLARGGATLEAAAPYDAIPVHVRAGSIVPVGPELEHTGERAPDPITLYVYAGADGKFVLYEDQGLTHAYERGAFSRIPLEWRDSARTLVVGTRQGRFDGMLRNRSFAVVLVSPRHPVGFSFAPKVDATVTYTGERVEIRL